MVIMKLTDIFSTKYNIALWVLFIISVLINFIFSLFADGSSGTENIFYILKTANCLLRVEYFLMGICINFADFFSANNKLILVFVYNFIYLFLPFIILLWNFQITKMTGRKDIFAVSLLLYCIFAAARIYPEMALISMVTMLLYNYLSCTEREYSKLDTVLVILFSLSLFNRLSVFAFIAPLLYLTAVRTFGKTKSGIVRIVKFVAAVIIICAGIYNFWIWFISFGISCPCLLCNVLMPAKSILFFVPLALLVLVIKDFLKETFADEFLSKIITVALVIGISQILCQIVIMLIFG